MIKVNHDHGDLDDTSASICDATTAISIRFCEDFSVRREIRYVELKNSLNDDGPTSIVWVTFSKTGRTLYHRGRSLRRIVRGGVNSNQFDTMTGEEFWVSGVKGNGEDRLWAGRGPVEIDPDAREEYEKIIERKKKNYRSCEMKSTCGSNRSTLPMSRLSNA